MSVCQDQYDTGPLLVSLFVSKACLREVTNLLIGSRLASPRSLFLVLLRWKGVTEIRRLGSDIGGEAAMRRQDYGPPRLTRRPWQWPDERGRDISAKMQSDSLLRLISALQAHIWRVRGFHEGADDPSRDQVHSPLGNHRCAE